MSMDLGYTLTVVFAYFAFLTLMITAFEEPDNSVTKEIPVDTDMTCFDAVNTSYESVCYDVEKVNVSMDSEGNIDAKAVGSTYKEEAVP